MGFFKSTEGSIISDYFKLIEKVGNLSVGHACDVALYNDHLVVTDGISKNTATLNYSQITDVYRGLKSEITEKNKSVIGRAIAGGMLLGGIGAVVGGMSGTGKKQKKETKMYFIISYLSSAGDECFLCFEDTRMYKGRKIADKLREFCNLNEKPVDSQPTATQL